MEGLLLTESLIEGLFLTESLTARFRIFQASLAIIPVVAKQTSSHPLGLG